MSQIIYKSIERNKCITIHFYWLTLIIRGETGLEKEPLVLYDFVKGELVE